MPALAQEEPVSLEDVGDLTPFQIRHVLREARRLYEADEEDADPATLAEAARAFALAAEKGEPGEINLDAVRLAEAMAWMRAERPEDALEAFEKIQGFEAAADRARHRLLRGNAHLAAGERAFSQEDFDTAKEQMGEAIESYIASLMDDPTSEAAKQNLELAHRRLRFVEENEPPPPPPENQEDEDEDQDQEDGDDEQDQEPQPQPGEADESEEGEDDPEPQPGEEEEDDDTRPEEGDPGEDEAEGDPAPADPGEEDDPREMEMDPELDDLTDDEIESTLNALLEQERRLRDEILRNRHRRQIPVEKDW